MQGHVNLKPLFHRDKECIGIYYSKDPVINNAISKGAGAKWSRTNQCWWIPLTKENYDKLILTLKGKAQIKNDALRQYLSDKKKKNETVVIPFITNKKTEKQSPLVTRNEAILYNGSRIHAINAHVLPAMKQRLRLKAYSESTIKTYLGEMTQLLLTLKNIPADDLTQEHLKRYFVFCFEKLRLTENTLHSRINALKFYYEQVLGREKFFWDIPRPKRPLLMPKLLNESEIAKLFNALSNRKHKAMLFTAYSAGLRVSEIVNLRLGDIDSKRMQILVQRAKGKKDRYVNLSPLLLDILRKYIKESNPRPKEFLFESDQTHTAYPARTVQQIFSNAKHKAGIRKVVGIHSLRHSFATHLLDKGTDIRYIKDLLGHFNIKTTERYLHVSKKQLVNIISPFDDLWKKEAIDW
ncbi:MAG: site-specific integrase [Chitinophagales bacterium]|nr:site-specific integrase [Chitinophagales bacterium]